MATKEEMEKKIAELEALQKPKSEKFFAWFGGRKAFYGLLASLASAAMNYFGVPSETIWSVVTPILGFMGLEGAKDAVAAVRNKK